MSPIVPDCLLRCPKPKLFIQSCLDQLWPLTVCCVGDVSLTQGFSLVENGKLQSSHQLSGLFIKNLR